MPPVFRIDSFLISTNAVGMAATREWVTSAILGCFFVPKRVSLLQAAAAAAAASRLGHLCPSSFILATFGGYAVLAKTVGASECPCTVHVPASNDVPFYPLRSGVRHCRHKTKFFVLSVSWKIHLNLCACM